jgi:hypothetical protein
MWYLSKSQSTSIHVYQIKVESQINVLHIKSPFWCSDNMECRLMIMYKCEELELICDTFIDCMKVRYNRWEKGKSG